MPDNNNTNGSAVNNEVNQLFDEGRSTTNGRTSMQVLESIEKQLENLVKNGGSFNDMSASNANNRYGRNGSTFYQSLNGRSGARGTFRDFEQEFKKSLMDNLLGDEFKKSMQSIRDQLAKDLGVEIGDLPKALGKLAGKQLANRIGNSSIGKALLDPIKKYRDNLAKDIKDAYARGRQKGLDNYMRNAAGGNGTSGSSVVGKVADIVGGDKADMIKNIANASSEAGNMAGVLGGLSEVASTVGPKLLDAGAATTGATIAVSLITNYLKKAVTPALQDFKKMLAKTSESMDRYEKSRQSSLDYSRERIAADVKTMVETPFKILEDAAQKWYEAWDNNLRTISATQGYTKEQVYQLYGVYADRLRSEGLTDVIGSSDIINNLSNVLSAGLQGAAAEEFAYIATKLNAAIPTQDFFNYTEGYITAVSNAMNQGKSQAEAIAMANEELETFANSLLYAGREISGGFTVGLKNAEALFQKAEQIAQAGRYGNGSQLGATLTAISSISGAIAPDLASGIVEAVYKAAVGGNNSDIVALRSLAGINASNTEFLQALIQNPQQVFGDLFSKLSTMQNMAPGAYMEVAEGLSSIFGVSMDSLARVDFSQLASAVRASANPNSALNQNMKLLQSGQTTTNAEILRMREINQYIAEDGLGYVLDSEAGRAVQQHMWEEALAKEMMETTYGVELKGSAMQALNSIGQMLNKLANFMSIGALADKLSELSITVKQEDAMKDDIRQMLELGKIGADNTTALDLLVGVKSSSALVKNYVEMLGGQSSYKATQAAINSLRKNSNHYMSDELMVQWAYAFSNPMQFLGDVINGNGGLTYGATKGDFQLGRPRYALEASAQAQGINSAYAWNRVGKSALARFNGYSLTDYDTGVSAVALSTAVSTAQSQSRLTDNLQKMLDSMDEYYSKDNTRTYSDFVATAKQFGIADYAKALEQGGLTEEDVRSRYMDLQNQTAITKQAERYSKEESFWEDTVLQITTSNTWLDSINSTATNIFNLFDDFVSAWKDYFIEHTVYNSAYTRDAVEKVLSAERDSSETAIYALADALTQNDTKLLLDPTLQTNALLAQILKVANAILVQGGTGTAISLPDTLAGLALGIVSTE